MHNTEQEIAEILLFIKAVTINSEKPFKYTSGLLSPVYSDMRLLMSYPGERRRVVDLWLEELKKFSDFDVLAGTSTGGIAPAAWLSDRLGKPMVYIRGKAKGHGKQNQVEGVIEKGQKAIVIEDLISTGGSSIESVNALKHKGVEVVGISAIFNYTLPQSKENFTQNDIKINSLTTFPDVVEFAVSQGTLKKAEQTVALDWLEDSKGWAKRHNLA
jgi:orotate phosphoribosyltransferase